MGGSQELVKAGQEGRALARLGDHLPTSGDRIDLSGTVSFFRRQFKLIAAVVAVTMLAGLVISLMMGKTFRAEATVMLTNNAAIVAQSATTPDSQTALSGQVVDTQVEIITSRDMANRVADALGLAKGMNQDQRRELIDALQENVAARRTGDSYALTISFDAENAKDAATIVNEYTRQFVQWEPTSQKQRNADARQIVEQRLAALRKQAQSDTQALQQYRISNNLLSTSGASLTEQEISTYNQEVTRARAEAAEDQARLQTALAQLRSGSTGDDVGEALGSPVISSLRSQEAAAAAEVADLAARYGPNHPQLIRARSQLQEVRHQIQAEIGRVISNLKAKQEVSAQRLASLNGSLAGARAKLSQSNAAMVGLSELERAAESSQSIYETYLSRYKELLAAEGSEKPNARVLTLAEVPLFPRSPNIPLNLALSLVIGFGLGVLAAYIAESLSHGIASPDELEKTTGKPFLASIPLLASVNSAHSHAISAIQGDPKSVFTESFRSLGTAIDHASHGNDQVIAITSALPGEGKTVMSCCLSHVLAAGGMRTMLIDCDMRRRGISRLLDMRSHHRGLIEVLNGSVPLKFHEVPGDHVFYVLPISPSDEEPEHLLTGQPFIDLLNELRQSFDRIILDLPPVLPIASTQVLASRADAVVMAAKWRSTSTFALRSALKRLPEDEVNVVGVALSQVDMRRRAFLDRTDPNFYYTQYREYYS